MPNGIVPLSSMSLAGDENRLSLSKYGSLVGMREAFKELANIRIINVKVISFHTSFSIHSFLSECTEIGYMYRTSIFYITE